jgi:hypothetical protein
VTCVGSANGGGVMSAASNGVSSFARGPVVLF